MSHLEYDIYPARLDVIYDWRKRRHKLALVGDLGRTMPVTPPDAESLASVESWTIDDCIQAALRNAPEGLTSREIAERIEEELHVVQRYLSLGKDKRYVQVGRRKGPRGGWVYVWALDDDPVQRQRKARKPNVAQRVTDLLRTTPGLTAVEIAGRLGLDRRAVQRVLSTCDWFRAVGQEENGRGRPSYRWGVQ